MPSNAPAQTLRPSAATAPTEGTIGSPARDRLTRSETASRDGSTCTTWPSPPVATQTPLGAAARSMAAAPIPIVLTTRRATGSMRATVASRASPTHSVPSAAASDAGFEPDARLATIRFVAGSTAITAGGVTADAAAPPPPPSSRISARAITIAAATATTAAATATARPRPRRDGAPSGAASGSGAAAGGAGAGATTPSAASWFRIIRSRRWSSGPGSMPSSSASSLRPSRCAARASDWRPPR